ncbi:hypothetical protein GSI_05065 [Ganoderma sinense ZZ0214-1]|uniref:Uncharacterized protein n=1 Tax=Ganoderma sinense ZZ0214-1 TaxID=1077348 RepID=A0A2G8SGX0_9APHY|nr:hypothetical protein GSI_05065 [Ganoderma sinense ZZ0214-1]
MSVLAPLAPRDSTENWDEDFEFSRPTSSATPNPDDIAPGPRPCIPPKDPSTPLSKPPKSILNNWAEPGPSTPLKRIQHTENWDDDFQDADSPQNWDDEFEEHAHTSASPGRRTPCKRASWGTADDEDKSAFADREDDRTVTTHPRGVPFHIPIDTPPPVPPLPPPLSHRVRVLGARVVDDRA